MAAEVLESVDHTHFLHPCIGRPYPHVDRIGLSVFVCSHRIVGRFGLHTRCPTSYRAPLSPHCPHRAFGTLVSRLKPGRVQIAHNCRTVPPGAPIPTWPALDQEDSNATAST